MSAQDPPPRPPDRPLEELAVDELAAAVRYHNWLYFTLSAPEIDDYAFDRLTRRLSELAPGHPVLDELVSDGASGQKFRHERPMLSLDKCYDEAKLALWTTDKGKPAFQGDVIETPKIDGVAASLHYDADGRLAVAVTRGDGRVGEIFTPNAMFIEEIPAHLTGPPLAGPVEVRGEIYMRLSVFQTMSDQFSNPRNTTAGAIKQKVARKTAGYRLSFFVYDVFGVEFRTEMEKVAWSRARGLTPVETHLVSPEGIQASYERWLARRDEVDFETDGVVYKVNQVSEHGRLGSTAHHPRWAVAYKFQGDSGSSTLRSIEWSVARTGTITPVAIIEPVELSGAMVSRCSLHNLSRVRELGLTPGATVVAMRRGGVIPHIESVSALGEGEVCWPQACPSCGAATTVHRNEQRVRVIETLACSTPATCPAAIRGTIEHFTKALDIEGFGPKMVEKLMAASLLHTVADLYRLRPENFVGMEGVGEVLAAKLVAGVEAKRRLPLVAFLTALGVEGLGEVTTRTLAERFRSLETILALTHEDLEALEGFQETLAETIVTGIAQRRAEIEALCQVVTVQAWVPSVATGGTTSFAGLSVVFTGAMATMERKAAQTAVRQRGGATPSSVTRELDFLVVGDKGSPLLGEGSKSSKQKKAEGYNADGTTIAIITESRFLELLVEETMAASDDGPDPDTPDETPQQGKLPL